MLLSYVGFAAGFALSGATRSDRGYHTLCVLYVGYHIYLRLLVFGGATPTYALHFLGRYTAIGCIINSRSGGVLTGNRRELVEVFSNSNEEITACMNS